MHFIKRPTEGRIPLVLHFVPCNPRRGGGGGTDADVPTQPALHASLRLRSKELRSRSRVSGSVSKLKLFASPERRLRIESDTVHLVFLSFSRAQKGLSSSPRTRVASAATRVPDPRRSQHCATVPHWSLVFSIIYREATAL